MSVVGIEPTTNGLKGHCSTIELHARLRREFYHGGRGESTMGCDTGTPRRGDQVVASRPDGVTWRSGDWEKDRKLEIVSSEPIRRQNFWAACRAADLPSSQSPQLPSQLNSHAPTAGIRRLIIPVYTGDSGKVAHILHLVRLLHNKIQAKVQDEEKNRYEILLVSRLYDPYLPSKSQGGLALPQP
jgi:hypothetical protein